MPRPIDPLRPSDRHNGPWPLHGAAAVDPFDFVRTIAVARLLMPKSHVRLSAGRSQMSDEMQALCFMAGANSIFYGDKLLTTENPDENHDLELFRRLGITAEPGPEHDEQHHHHSTHDNPQQATTA